MGSDCDSGFVSESETGPTPCLIPRHVILDFRTSTDFHATHLPAAISVPLKSLSSETLNPFTDSETLATQWRELEALFKDDNIEEEDESTITGWRKALVEKDVSVTLVCYDGDTSRIGNSVLRNQGIAASSIRGGMNAVLAAYPDLDFSKVIPTKEAGNSKNI